MQSDRPTVVYDANVLYPAQLRDFLMWVAVNKLVEAHWTEAIQHEWMRNLSSGDWDKSWPGMSDARERPLNQNGCCI
jgi:hypothetical protein